MQLVKKLWDNKHIFILPLLAFAFNVAVYAGGRRLAADKVHYMLDLPWDSAIPFVPWTILIYWGCFAFWAGFYLWIASKNKNTAAHFFLMHFLGELVCFLFFIFLPTTIARPEVVGSDFWSAMVRIEYALDEPNNLFPSIHCFLGWICWIALRKQKECASWSKWAVFAFAVAICVSTVTLKQHFLLDIVGAIVLAEAVNKVADIPELQQGMIRLFKM